MSLDNGGDGAREGLFSALKNTVATLVAIVKTRVELLVTEIEEEKYRLMSMWSKAIAAAFLLGMGVLLGVFALAMAFWEQRLLIFGIASGAVLLEKDAIQSYKEKLIPLSTLITPNIPEAEVLSGLSIQNEEDMKKAALALMDLGPSAVLVKGGHSVEDARDILYDGREFHVFSGRRISTENTHGTGCTLSSAIAASMARGLSLTEAVGEAKKYMEGAIRRAAVDSVGHGHGPVHHFWFYGENWGHME